MGSVRKFPMSFSIMIRLHCMCVGCFTGIGYFPYFTALATLQEIMGQGYNGAIHITVN